MKIVCVVPTVRPECHAKFVEAWAGLFRKHSATLITVWDGENPVLTRHPGPNYGEVIPSIPAYWIHHPEHRDLFCRHSDVVRNLGFVAAARMGADRILTLDDDCYPVTGGWLEENGFAGTTDKRMLERLRLVTDDPIQAHLDVLEKKVSISWMNTAHASSEYLRGVPYGVRDEAPVMLSHGVWVGTPDFDGETQLRLESNGGVPPTLPYYVGPVPKGVMFPVCGMNVMVRKETLPYLYFAPMGPDAGVNRTECINVTGREIKKGEWVTTDMVETREVPSLHRFGDIWMGISLKKEFDKLGWAIYTGASVIHHTRASDAKKNFEQEKLGREWNEYVKNLQKPPSQQFLYYFASYSDKRERYRDLILSLQEGGK